MSTLFDYCLLQMHCSCSTESRFTCVFNEHESDADKCQLFFCEQNEFKNLVHLTLDFQRASASAQSHSHHAQTQVF